MLYVIHRANHPELDYRGGQEAIVHLEANLRHCTEWANQVGVRWAFTLSNAGSGYCEDRAELNQLDKLDWTAINARNWQVHKEGKQAEFLVEKYFPFELITQIGVKSRQILRKVESVLQAADHKPLMNIRAEWYY